MRAARLLWQHWQAAMLTGCSGGDAPASPPRLRDIAEFLVPHGDGVRRHDRAAFMSGVSDMKAARHSRAERRAAFDNLVIELP